MADPSGAIIKAWGYSPLNQINKANVKTLQPVWSRAMETGANTRSSTLPSALGSGIPTVAVCGRETDLSLFRDGDNVAFADAMTERAFAVAALRLLQDPAARTRVGEGGRRLYAEHLSWQRIGDRLLADTNLS